ncbi:serine/threonine protein kinase [Rhizohabitans arisaemae]|uniref:serine/threonine protein kinase n=1 Tax=Rhizohabitans arisaemae TaxID=2720610 RepID=UPI0024B10132|nr:hypothetical protein [Rhizohabitans arisaemae]
MPDITSLRRDDPESLGGYRLLGRLGDLYVGEAASGMRVVIRPLGPYLRRRLVPEVTAARQVASFCTAQVIDADLDAEPPYLVSEYVDGPALSTLVETEGPRQGSALSRLAVCTATALDAIHRTGTVHHDFTPERVLIGAAGPRVIGFGVPRRLSVTSYTAPEQLTDISADQAADMFSWAATILFAAGGRPPYRPDRVRPHITGELAEVLAACLDRKPERRPSARNVLLQLLGQEEQVGEESIPTRELPRRPVARSAVPPTREHRVAAASEAPGGGPVPGPGAPGPTPGGSAPVQAGSVPAQGGPGNFGVDPQADTVPRRVIPAQAPAPTKAAAHPSVVYPIPAGPPVGAPAVPAKPRRRILPAALALLAIPTLAVPVLIVQSGWLAGSPSGVAAVFTGQTSQSPVATTGEAPAGGPPESDAPAEAEKTTVTGEPAPSAVPREPEATEPPAPSPSLAESPPTAEPGVGRPAQGSPDATKVSPARWEGVVGTWRGRATNPRTREKSLFTVQFAGDREAGSATWGTGPRCRYELVFDGRVGTGVRVKVERADTARGCEAAAVIVFTPADGRRLSYTSDGGLPPGSGTLTDFGG